MPDELLTFNEIQEKGATFMNRLWESFTAYVPTLILALVLFIIGTIVNKLVMRLLGRGLKKSRLDVTVHSFLSSLVKIALYSLVIIITLTILGIPMNSIIAVVGSAGLAIGLAMQTSLSNVAGGVIILVTKPFKAGDYVDINDTSGTVEEISVITTKLCTPDNKIIYVPNGTVSNAVIVNYSRQTTRRVETVFSISHKNEFRKALKAVKTVISEHTKILREPEPFARVKSISQGSIDIETKVWVNSSDYWDVFYDLTELVKEAFDREGIIIPCNQLDVNMVNDL